MSFTGDAVVITEHDGELLYLGITRGKGPYEGEKALPGGHIEDESVEDGIIRELEEEANLEESEVEILEGGEGPVRGSEELIYDPRYEGKTKEELQEEGFSEDEAEWLLDHELEEDDLRRDQEFSYNFVVLRSEGLPETRGGDDAESAEWRRVEEDVDDYLAFGQQRVLKAAQEAYENLAD